MSDVDPDILPPAVEPPVEDSRWVKVDRMLIAADQRLDQILHEERTTAQVMVITTAAVLLVMFLLARQQRALQRILDAVTATVVEVVP